MNHSASSANRKVLPLGKYFVQSGKITPDQLDKALDYICSHDGVWRATGWEIADWYYQHYYKDPGPLDPQ